MPTPYGSRGGMAFSAAELHVLRRSLAHALHSDTDRAALTATEVQDCLRLAHALDEAVCEAGRLRAFLIADLGRYRAALPGSLTGYLELLQDALAAGYQPAPDDLAALRALRGNPVAAALLERCRLLAERSLRGRLAPAPRTRLLALRGGLDSAVDRPSPPPPPPQPAQPRPERPIPTPGEVFPPRRKPAPPPDARAAG